MLWARKLSLSIILRCFYFFLNDCAQLCLSNRIAFQSNGNNRALRIIKILRMLKILRLLRAVKVVECVLPVIVLNISYISD